MKKWHKNFLMKFAVKIHTNSFTISYQSLKIMGLGKARGYPQDHGVVQGRIGSYRVK